MVTSRSKSKSKSSNKGGSKTSNPMRVSKKSKLETSFKRMDKFGISKENVLQIQNEYDMSFKDIDQIQKMAGGTGVLVEADGHGFYIFADSEDAYNYAVNYESEMLDDALGYAFDTPDSIKDYVEISDSDIEFIASDLVDDDVAERNIGDLRILAKELKDDLYVSNSDKEIDVMSKAELEYLLVDALQEKHVAGLKDDPVEYLVNDVGKYETSELLQQDFVEVDTKQMAKDEIDRNGVGSLLAGADGTENLFFDNDGDEIYVYRYN